MIHEKAPIQIYMAPDGKTTLEVQLDNEMIWLSQEQIARLLGVERSVITKHINNIIKTKELTKD